MKAFSFNIEIIQFTDYIFFHLNLYFPFIKLNIDGEDF